MSTIKTVNIQHPSAASPAIELTAAGGLWLGGGKILQIVRATDSTVRSTTSTSYVDASLSVTITPQKSDSAVLLIHSTKIIPSNSQYGYIQITDSSNNGISGASDTQFGVVASTQRFHAVTIGYATPATTAATTYKVRFKSSSGTVELFNSDPIGQLFAIEVSA